MATSLSTAVLSAAAVVEMEILGTADLAAADLVTAKEIGAMEMQRLKQLLQLLVY